MYYFGDIMYAMGMNIMKSVCVKYGQTNDTGKKFVKFDDVVKLVGDAVKEPNNSGSYQDYIELMKLYDKNENGTIMIAELETFLNLLRKNTDRKIMGFPHVQTFMRSINSIAVTENERYRIICLKFIIGQMYQKLILVFFKINKNCMLILYVAFA